jgi:tRNA (adenine37-N6)-methyltransferase
MEIHPVGIVRSPVCSRREMPVHGVTAEVEIYADYAPALAGIEHNSHLILMGWMHEADRSVLRAVARKVSSDLPLKGVFALRSPSRPNPVSVSVVRLLEIMQGRLLRLDHLDLIDGTPVVDIKPYQPGWDCVFSATGNDRTEKIRKMAPDDYRISLIREAVNYHGELCEGLAVGVRIAEASTRILETDLRSPDVSITVGSDPCITDSLIGITGATRGNTRLRHADTSAGADVFVIAGSGRTVTFRIRRRCSSYEEALACTETSLFDITVSRPAGTCVISR